MSERDCEAITSADCLQEIASICACAFGVEANVGAVSELVEPILIEGTAEPCRLFAYIALRTPIANELLGDTLAKHIRPYVHNLQFDLPPPVMPMSSQLLLQELTDTRAALTQIKYRARASSELRAPMQANDIGFCLAPVREVELPFEPSAVRKRRKTLQNVLTRTRLLKMAVATQNALWRMLDTLPSAYRILRRIDDGEVW